MREVKAKRVEFSKEEDIQLNMIYAYEETDIEPMSLNVVKTQTTEIDGTAEIKQLTEQFEDIFEEPRSLPPFRKDHNHKIVLKEGSNPVN